MDILSYRMGQSSAGGGGGEAVLVNKDISANGTYNASSDSADGYKKVVVDVPNSYAAGDEGKVVSNGALVAQGSDTVTANNTYDTTLISSLTVNVPVPAYETGTYIAASSTNDAWRVPLSKKYSHFLMVTEDTFSQNTTSASTPLYIVYADENGYSAIKSQTNSGFMQNGWSVNRLVSEYATNSFVNFGNDYVELRLLGNGAFISPAPELTYVWFAW